MHSGEIVDVPDLAVEERWPEYRPPALGLGVRSSMSFPLHDSDAVIGALNFYGFVPRAFGPAEHTTGERFAAEASRVLLLAQRIADQARLARDLAAALASRRLIDQAIGVTQNRFTADEAFAILRAASQSRNVKVRLVAADIITAVSGQPPVESSGFQR